MPPLTSISLSGMALPSTARTVILTRHAMTHQITTEARDRSNSQTRPGLRSIVIAGRGFLGVGVAPAFLRSHGSPCWERLLETSLCLVSAPECLSGSLD